MAMNTTNTASMTPKSVASVRMRKRTLPLARVYQLLEPGPVVLVTTAHKGRTNVMAMSWHTTLEFEPPLVCCVVSNRNYSFATLRATKECLRVPFRGRLT